MPNFIVKEVSAMFAERNGRQIQSVIAFVLRAAAIYMCLLGVCLLAFWYLHLALEYRVFGVLMWFHVAIQILNACRSALLRAVGRIVKGQLIDRLIQPSLALAFTTAGWVILGSRFNVIGALVALLASNALCLSFGAYWVRQELKGLPSGVIPRDEGTGRLKGLLNLSGVGLLNSIFTNGVILIIGWVGSLEAAALYRLAAAVAIILNYLQEVMIQVVAPKVAELWYMGDESRLIRILMIGAVTNSATLAIGTAALALVGQEILAIAYGSEYRQAYSALVILSSANLAYALGGYRDLLLNMSGHAKQSFRVSLVLVPAGLILATVGVLAFEQTGAAIAVLCFQVAASVWLTFTTKKYTGIDPSIFGLFRNRHERGPDPHSPVARFRR
jgi:O-antigen/teichoic acid export membrane protein